MSGNAAIPPPHFLVIVPGIMGSKLRDPASGRIVWVDFGSVPLNPFEWDSWLDQLLGSLQFPSPLEPAGIMDEVLFVPPWAKQEQYSRLVHALEEIGYQVDPAQPSRRPSAYTFAYDWRQDNRVSARQLGEAIEGLLARHPGAKAWILGHSMGGLVARWYIEQEGGKQNVGRLMLLASPWDGAPKAMHILFNGFDFLFRRRFNLFKIPERTRAVIRTFPSIYQLLPHQNPFLRDQHNQPIDLFTGHDWLDDETERTLLQDGRRFNEDLGTTTSVETLCIFGRRRRTTTQGLLRIAAGGHWHDIEWGATEAGDGTVPERSAVHLHAQQTIPVAAGHGDIYVHPAVKEILEWELIDKYHVPGRPTRATVVTERLSVLFTPDRDVYSPGETIILSAFVHENTGETRPVSNASIRVELRWRQSLPGTPSIARVEQLPSVRLRSSPAQLGTYEGSMVAPVTEGYYQLQSVVNVPGERTVRLEELVAIEGEDDSAVPGRSSAREGVST